MKKYKLVLMIIFVSVMSGCTYVNEQKIEVAKSTSVTQNLNTFSVKLIELVGISRYENIFSGDWIDSSGKGNVAVTESTNDVLDLISKLDLKVNIVEYSKKKLETEIKEVETILIDENFFVYFDVIKNSIILGIEVNLKENSKITFDNISKFILGKEYIKVKYFVGDSLILE